VTLPRPTPGLVIRYSYLWRREANQGETSGRKLRPCAIILATVQHDDETIVYVAPLTHSPPAEPWSGIVVPTAVKRRLQLDEEPTWVVTTEFNAFRWPGVDIAALPPSADAKEFVYGELPERTVTQLLDAFRENVRQGRVRVVKRTE
jgi:hypothetical protein